MGNERQRASGRALDATLQNEVLHPAVELERDIPVRSSQRVAVAIQNPTADYRPDAIRETAASQWLLDLPSVSGGPITDSGLMRARPEVQGPPVG